MNPTVIIYTDGSCYPNPGAGGWGAVIAFRKNGKVVASKEIYGGAKRTTNNRMEMMAVIKALEELNRPCFIYLYVDSKYVCGAFTEGWLEGWRKRGFKGVKNLDLWERLIPLTERHFIEWTWVRGHTGDPGNERADALALKGRKSVGG